jgi:hypothetical protein
VKFPSAEKAKLILGWLTVALSTAICCFWAFWGIIENFHEGWYHDSFGRNVAMMLVQYLGIMFVFLAATLISLGWRWVGLVIHLTLAGFAIWFFSGAAEFVLWVTIVGPLVFLGFGYLVGKPEPTRWAYRGVLVLPLLTAFGFGVEPAIRIAGRFDDGFLGARTIETSNGYLTWAPVGPGWPTSGMSWDQANHNCCYLNEAGTQLMDEPQDIWRLPTIEEVVAAQHRHGKTCKGRWNLDKDIAEYEIRPDKESPLWNLRSPVIYWWTATEVEDDRVWMIAYDGRAWQRKKFATGHQGFRAVKQVDKSLR